MTVSCLRRACTQMERLWPCHQDPDLGHADSKPADDTTSTETETQVELLWTGYNGENRADVLHKS